jgi:hypothetical protein
MVSASKIMAAATVVLSASPAASQGLPVSSPQEIAAGARSCSAATSAAGVDVNKLTADGWRRASVSDHGQSINNAGLFFGKGHLLLTLSSNSAKICGIVARIQSTAAFAPIIDAMGQQLGVPGKRRPNETDTAYWFPAGHIVQMKLTGKTDAPAVRVVVGYAPLEKK